MASSVALFTALEKWCPRAKENFLTEVITVVLRNNPALACLAIQRIVGFELDPKTLVVESQVPHDHRVIDLRIMDQESCVLVEVKLDAPLRNDQLQIYSKILEENYRDKKKKRLIALLRWPPLKRDLSATVIYVYLGELFSHMYIGAKDKHLVSNEYLIQEMFRFFEDKHMTAFEGLTSAGQVVSGFEEVRSFVQQCRSLKEHLHHRIEGVRRQEECLLGKDVLAGWYFDITPKQWTKERDPSLWCGFYADTEQISREPIAAGMYLWSAFYCRPNDERDRERIERIMRDKKLEVIPDEEFPDYLTGEIYSDSFSKLILGKGATEQAQILTAELNRMFAHLKKMSKRILI